jgi:hypothetical protein
MVRDLRDLRDFPRCGDVTNMEQKKFLYIYIYIYINLPKLGFYGLDTVPFRPCIFTVF